MKKEKENQKDLLQEIEKKKEIEEIEKEKDSGLKTL